MTVNLYAERVKSFRKVDRGGLILEMRNDNRSDVKPDAAEGVNQAEGVKVVCDAEVASYLVLFDVVCGNDDDYFRAVLELEQHFDLRIG